MKKKVFMGVSLLLAVALVSACGIPQEDYDAAVAAKEAADTQVASLQSDLATAESDLSTAESDLSTAESDLATAESALSTAESALSTAESDLSTAESDLSTAESDLATAQSDLATTQSDLAAAESDLATAESAASSARSAKAAAERDLATAESALATAESDLAAAETLIAELEAAAAPAEEEVVEEEVVEEEVVEEEVVAAEYEALPTYEHPAELSFDATEVINDEYGVSLKYPSSWADNLGEGQIAGRIDPNTLPYADCRWLYVEAWPLDGFDTLDSFPALLIDRLTEGPVEILRAGPTTLADGTPAYAAEYTCTIATWAVHSFAVGVIVGDQWIGYYIDTIEMYFPFDEDELFEIAHTLLVLE